MKKIIILQTIAALAAMLLVLGLAYGLDRWYLDLQQSLSILQIYIEEFYLQALAIRALFALSLIGLNWFVNDKASNNRLLSWILLIFGLLLTIYPLLHMIPPLRQIHMLYHNELTPTKSLSTACAFIAVIGAFGIFAKSQRIKVPGVIEKFAPLIAALLVLAVAYGLDLWRDASGNYLTSNYEFSVFYIQRIAIHVLFAISLIGLYWLINIKLRPNRLAAGMLIIFATFLNFFPLLTALGSLRRLIDLQYNPLYPNNVLASACVFIVIIAVFGLFRRSEEKTATLVSNRPSTYKSITLESEENQP